MRVWKPTYKNKKGKMKAVSKFWVELRIHDETVKRFAGFADKTATEELGRKIQRLVSFKVAGLPPDPEMSRWLEGIPAKLTKRLVEVGLLEESRLEANKSILEHLSDFSAMMYRTCNKTHAELTVANIRRIIEACKFKLWSDVKGSEIEQYLNKRCKAGLSKQTAKYYVVAFKHFSRWMLEEKRANYIPKIKVGKPKKNNRPAFEKDEIKKILETTINAPERFGLSGFQRYLLYVIAIETTLRRGELATLTPASFSPKDRTLFVKGEEHTKHPEDVVQQLSESTAAVLQEYIVNKMPNVLLFPMPQRTSKMIEQDSKDAGVDIYNAKGEKRCFHSLRHTGASFLCDAGVHPKVVQEILRHRDINMTMTRYAHTLRNQKRKAVNSMPDLTIKRATGTK